MYRCPGIQRLLHFKVQGQLGRDLKHKTNSPRRGCGVKHQDKGHMSHREILGFYVHICQEVVNTEVSPFMFCFFNTFESKRASLTNRGEIRKRCNGSIHIFKEKTPGLRLVFSPLYDHMPHKSHTNSSQFASAASHIEKPELLWLSNVVSTFMPLMPSHATPPLFSGFSDSDKGDRQRRVITVQLQ